MKTLPKHLRPRYRYLAVNVEAWPDASFDRRSFQSELWASARALVGDVGSAMSEPTVLRFSLIDGWGWAIVRCRKDGVRVARAAISCMREIDGDPVGLRILGISGTVRGCEEKYIRERPEAVTERNVAFRDADQAAVVRNDRVDVRMDGAYTGATDLDLESE